MRAVTDCLRNLIYPNRAHNEIPMMTNRYGQTFSVTRVKCTYCLREYSIESASHNYHHCDRSVYPAFEHDKNRVLLQDDFVAKDYRLLMDIFNGIPSNDAIMDLADSLGLDQLTINQALRHPQTNNDPGSYLTNKLKQQGPKPSKEKLFNLILNLDNIDSKTKLFLLSLINSHV